MDGLKNQYKIVNKFVFTEKSKNRKSNYVFNEKIKEKYKYLASSTDEDRRASGADGLKGKGGEIKIGVKIKIRSSILAGFLYSDLTKFFVVTEKENPFLCNM